MKKRHTSRLVLSVLSIVLFYGLCILFRGILIIQQNNSIYSQPYCLLLAILSIICSVLTVMGLWGFYLWAKNNWKKPYIVISGVVFYANLIGLIPHAVYVLSLLN